MPLYCNNRHLNPKKIAFFIAWICFLPLSGFSQAELQGSLNITINSFNGINLGSDISSIPHDELSYLDNNNKFDADSCLIYALSTSDSTKYQADLNLELIALRTYKNKIVNIYLFFKRSIGYNILRNFLANYGVFTNKPNDYVDIYDWKSILASVSLRYELKTDLGVAIFESNTLKNQILADKIKRKGNESNQANTNTLNSSLIKINEAMQ